MPPEYPGVYVEEITSGVRTITGVSTSTALFIGGSSESRPYRPMKFLNITEVERTLPTEQAGSSLVRSLRLFFTNGGHRCHVIPLADAPTLDDYKTVFAIADEKIDLFNLLVLPRAGEGVDLEEVWGPASKFCHRRRAFLLMDPPPGWDDPATATDRSTRWNVVNIRAGLVKDHAALFYPDLLVHEGGREVRVGPSGAIAGLVARVDGERGVWKAPAGTEADIRGIAGLTRTLTDQENGELNVRGINVIRAFPSGIVNWGAKTMDGDDSAPSEWKYIPVRRLALYIEESLFRGTHWVVFEPNDEPLWAQIRLNLGTFMHGLFRQGAFQGSSPKDAYFVKCDNETTTQDDINRGIVNILVGFAPLKPAEFVVVKISQIAGQIET